MQATHINTNFIAHPCRHWILVQKGMASALKSLGDRVVIHNQLVSTKDVMHTLSAVPHTHAHSPVVVGSNSITAFEAKCYLLLALRTAGQHLQAELQPTSKKLGAKTFDSRLTNQGLNFSQQLSTLLLLPWLPQAMPFTTVASVLSLPEVTTALTVRGIGVMDRLGKLLNLKMR